MSGLLPTRQYKGRWESPSGFSDGISRFPETPPTRTPARYPRPNRVCHFYTSWELRFAVEDKRSISRRLLRARWNAADTQASDAVPKARLCSHRELITHGTSLKTTSFSHTDQLSVGTSVAIATHQLRSLQTPFSLHFHLWPACRTKF